MKLEAGLWLEGAYYIDRNQNDEVRVVGPNNHLYYGSTGLQHDHIRILDAHPSANEPSEIILRLYIDPAENFFADPAMGHIRRVRSLTQIFGLQEPTYARVARDHPGELAPNNISSHHEDDHATVTYLRTYGDHYYGFKIRWPKHVQLHRDDIRRGYILDGLTGPTEISLTTVTDELPPAYSGPLLTAPHYDLRHLDPYWRAYAEHLIDRTAAEIQHLVANGKTSGFDYGTLFPRDWIETADLIAGDLTPSALRYMYTEPLRHVNDVGAGWHEDIVGEFKYEREQELAHLSHNIDTLLNPDHPLYAQLKNVFGELDELFVTRQMIDIEPHYLLGLRLIPFASFDPDVASRLRRVAAFVLERAEAEELITFNKLAKPFRRQRGDEYYDAGNWRDSTMAFKKIHPVIAPFDVNAVFYPQALRVIRDHYQELQVDPNHVDRLIAKWDRVRNWYRFTNDDGLTAYALALYNIRHENGKIKYDQFTVNNIDEATDLFYGQPTEADVISFATRLLSPQYFYTPSGPILVGRGQGYDHTQYHGEVTWAKQAAYAIAGLERTRARGQAEGWRNSTLELIEEAITKNAEATLKAFRELDAIPELHYDDHGRARLYDDQPHPEGQMNKVQLWSAAAARRILHAYLPRTAAASQPQPAPQAQTA
jgi:hypothetical protein